MAKFKKIPQPDIDRQTRAQESHSSLRGLLVLLIAGAAIFFGVTQSFYTINAPNFDTATRAKEFKSVELYKTYMRGQFYHGATKTQFEQKQAQFKGYKNRYEKAKTQFAILETQCIALGKELGETIKKSELKKAADPKATKVKECPT